MEEEKPKIKIQINQITDEQIIFTLSNCDVALANTLRRIMLAQIPTMAIHTVNIYENSSPLPDQYLSHRLGLIPLDSRDIKKYNYDWLCDCGNSNDNDDRPCDKCRVYIDLQVQNTTEESYIVTTNDLKFPEYTNVRPVIYRSPETGREMGIPIIKLGLNQEVIIQCEAMKGYGKMHAKWSPVSVAVFQYEPVINIDVDLMDLIVEKDINNVKHLEAIRDSCPTKVFTVTHKDKPALEVKKAMNCMFCNECVKYCRGKQMAEIANEHNKPIPNATQHISFDQFITIGTQKDRFIFTVESTGVLSPADIVKLSFDTLRDKIKLISQEISGKNN